MVLAMVAQNMADSFQIVQDTMSLCPDCLKPLKAILVQKGNETQIVRECAQHGVFSSTIWRGKPEFSTWFRPKIPYRGGLRENGENGCPQDCGLCENHKQRTCTALIEITSACNLNCPVCFADSGSGDDNEQSLAELENILKQIMVKTGGCNLQISGGEPTMRDDLPEIVSLAVKCGFQFIQLNTNGIKLAKDSMCCKELAEAGLSSVFLQFDGLDDAIYKELRGRELLATKLRAIENISDANIGIVLVPTLKPDLNLDHVWDIVQFGLSRQPHVRGVHFQPMSYFGRFPKDFKPKHITLPEIMAGLEEQSQGILKMEDFLPPGCEHALCSFSAKYLREENKITRLGSASCDCKPQPALQGAIKSIAQTAKQWSAVDNGYECSDDELSQFIHKARHNSFSVSAMAFQDCWNINLERLQGCCIHVAGKEGKLIPFCAYNLTSRSGRSLHRPQGTKQPIQPHALENHVTSQLKLNDDWLRKDLEEKQIEWLRNSLIRAMENSEYYREKYKDITVEEITSYEDLTKIPFTSPVEIKENPYNFLTISQSQVEHIITMESSGSTGSAKRFFFSKKDVQCTKDFFVKGMGNLVGQDDTVLVLLPHELEASVGNLLIDSLNEQGIETQGMWPPENVGETIRTGLFSCVVGLPQHLLELSEQKIAFGQIKNMLLCSDYASPSLRKRIKNNCGSETFLHYGSTETGLGGAVECQAHDGCHVREEELLIEIIDPVTLKPLQDGEVGEVVITTLRRQAMPLFRYRSGDLASIDKRQCECGGGTARLKNIHGRMAVLQLAGNSIESHRVDDILFGVEGLLDYRMFLEKSRQKDKKTKINLDYVSHEDNAELARQIEKKLCEIPVVECALLENKVAIGSIVNKKQFSPDHRLKRTIIDMR